MISPLWNIQHSTCLWRQVYRLAIKSNLLAKRHLLNDYQSILEFNFIHWSFKLANQKVMMSSPRLKTEKHAGNKDTDWLAHLSFDSTILRQLGKINEKKSVYKQERP